MPEPRETNYEDRAKLYSGYLRETREKGTFKKAKAVENCRIVAEKAGATHRAGSQNVSDSKSKKIKRKERGGGGEKGWCVRDQTKTKLYSTRTQIQ